MAHFLSSRLQRLDGSHRVLYLLCRQRSLRNSPPASMGLAQRFSGRSGVGIYLRGSRQWADLGSSGMGDLVDMGLAADIHACPVAAVRVLSGAAHAGGRARAPRPL